MSDFKLNYAFFADFAEIDGETNKPNARGIFNKFVLEGFPVQIDDMYIVYSVGKPEECPEFTTKIKILDPRGNNLIEETSNKVEGADDTKYEIIHRVSDIVFYEPGEHRVEFYVDDKPIGQTDLPVKKS